MPRSGAKAADVSPRRAALRALIVLAATAVWVPAALATLAGFLGGSSWLLDLFSHWPVHYFFVLAVSGGVLLSARAGWLALAPAAFALLNLALILPTYWGAPEAIGPADRLVVCNMNAGNRTPEAVAAFLQEADADVVVLPELTPRLAAELETAMAEYPFRRALPMEGNFGIAVLSRMPVLSWEECRRPDERCPALKARLRLDGRELTLLAVHAVPPRGPELAELRGRQFERFASEAANAGPAIVAGDLNCTPWSPHFRRLLERGGLRDGRRGHGVRPTWPVGFWPMRIPIDHCLTTPDLAVTALRAGPDVGSDHLPLIVDFAAAKR